MSQTLPRISPFWDLVAYDMYLQGRDMGPSFDEAANTDKNRLSHAGSIHLILLQTVSAQIDKPSRQLFEQIFGQTISRYQSLQTRALRKPNAYQQVIEEEDTSKGRLKRQFIRDFSLAAMIHEGIYPYQGLDYLDGTECIQERPDLQIKLEVLYRHREGAFNNVMGIMARFNQLLQAMNKEPGFQKLTPELITACSITFGTPGQSKGLFGLLPRNH